MEGATRFRSGWQDFNNGIKNWAYRQDQLATTHPIAGVVRDTDETFLNFDGITYGKGASVLKQLAAAIGIDGFREGMRRYFRTHEYGNATLRDFLGALEAGSGRELGEWSRLWLETASLNTIAAEWESDGERLTRLALAQSAPADYPTLRPHHLEVGLLTEDGGGASVEAVARRAGGGARGGGGRPRTPAPGARLPQLQRPRLRQDRARRRVRGLGAGAHRARGRRPAAAAALVHALEHGARPPAEVDGLPRHRAREDRVRAQHRADRLRARPRPPPRSTATRPPTAATRRRACSSPRRARGCWPRPTRTRASSGRARSRASPPIPTTSPSRGGWRTARSRISGFELDQDMRWGVAARHTAFAVPGAEARVATEAGRDPSDRGQRARLRCQTAAPDAAVKAAALGALHGRGPRLALPRPGRHERLQLDASGGAAGALRGRLLRGSPARVRGTRPRVRHRLLRRPLPRVPRGAGHAGARARAAGGDAGGAGGAAAGCCASRSTTWSAPIACREYAAG